MRGGVKVVKTPEEREEQGEGAQPAATSGGPGRVGLGTDEPNGSGGESPAPGADSAGQGPVGRAGLLAAATLAGAAVLVDHAVAPGPDEPWALRWLRTAADHPLRVTVALALVFWAVRPHRRSGPEDAPDL